MRNKYGKIKTLYNYLVIRHRLPSTFPAWATIQPDDVYDGSRVMLPDKTVRFVTAGANLPFSDHIELSGRVASHIISYMVDTDGIPSIFLHSSYPNFRLRPVATEASYAHNFINLSKVLVNGKPVREKSRFIDILGKLTFINEIDGGIEVKRTFFPAVYTTAIIEKIEIENLNEEGEISVEVSTPVGEYISLSKYSLDGTEYLSRADVADDTGKMMFGLDPYQEDIVKAQDKKTFYVVYYTRPKEEDILVNCLYEEKKRNDFINSVLKGIRIETPEPLLDTCFTHAVLRGTESVFDTKAGLMHCPGGGAYYGAVWTNDQIEYSAPFFGYAGFDAPIEATINTIRMFSEEIDNSYKPMKKRHAIPSSISNCGDNVWNIVGDRGDTQMFASGASRFLLALGDRELANEFFKAIEFAVNFTKSRTDRLGRVKSDTDELEGRFPTTKYNLSTNALAYDTYMFASRLAEELGMSSQKYECFNLAAKQRNSIVRNFTGTVKGFKTFRYYKNNKVLRSWICMPMCVGIKDNAKATIDALFSEDMYQNGYMKTAQNRKTTWDRSLLFALRGGFKAGLPDKVIDYLNDYTHSRLLGSHAPYPYEAYPEGNGRHLSAESILYARIFVEGMLRLTVTGFGKFRITPSLPTSWKKFAVRHLVFAGMPIDIEINNNHLTILDQTGKTITECNIVNGQKIDINLFN